MKKEDFKLSRGNAAGTSLVDEIQITYDKLVKLLGEPNADNDGYKTDAEWELEVNGKILTIYNYKDGKNYIGENGLEVEDITNWHVGGAGNLDVEINGLKKLLKEV